MFPMNRFQIGIWVVLLSTGAIRAADYYPLEVGLTWITRTVAHQEDGRIDTLYDTTSIYEKGVNEEGNEIFRVRVKTNGGIGVDSIYFYKVGNVVYKRYVASDGEHLETDEYRTNLHDGMTYTASMVSLDTRDTLFQLQFEVKYIGLIQTPFSPFDSCFQVTATSPLLAGSSVGFFGPNVGRVKSSVQDVLRTTETELLYFGNGLPVTISRRNAPRFRSTLSPSSPMNFGNAGHGSETVTYNLLGRVSNRNNAVWNRILIGKL